MNDFHYKLDMAGFLWDVVSPVELEAGENCEPFLTERPGADVTLHFRLGQREETGELIREKSPRVWREADGALRIERTPAASVKACACILRREDDPLHVEGFVYPERARSFRRLDNLFDVSELELILLALGAVSLHSSLVRRPEGDAILFTAPSGTGKSTQAGLWEQFAGADTLNGDRSILRCIDGVWTAFGSPFAGTSGIYRNESAPVRALVVLRQAPENTIRRMDPAAAFRAVYSELVLPRWNTEAHEKLLGIIETITQQLPVYLLACTPDERPVRLLSDTLKGETL